MWWLILCAIVAVAIYLFIVKPMDYWEEKGIAYRKPWPLVGNIAPTMFWQKHFMDLIVDFYNDFPEKRYSGTFNFTKPTLLIRDLDLIKRITVKDFDHFTDHSMFAVDEDVDPLMGRNLSSLKGQRWRDMRATLSPSFTGSKMRGLFVLVSECAEQFTAHFVKKIGEGVMEVEMKDAFTRFTNDAIATCAFGVKCDSLEERENEFYVMGKQTTNFSGINGLKLLMMSFNPQLMKFLRIKFFSDNVSNFFRRIVKETMDLREKEGLVRPDMIHLLMEARKGQLKQDDQANSVDSGFATVQESDLGKTGKQVTSALTDDDIVAQALIFFFGGFDTSSTLMCLMAHSLAENPDVQEKLQAEIDETLEKCSGKLTYEAVMAMKYLDAVVSETLRLWPLGFVLDRMCVKDYKIEPELPDEKPLLLKKGDLIMIPVIGIHRNPQFFPNPKRFDPERFSDANKHDIQSYSYMPFGSGPRNCIASRFALLENKTLFVHLLSKFDLVLVKRTVTPMKIHPPSINPTPKGGYWLGLRQRAKISC